MDIQGAVLFVTGANRGLGRAFAEEALRRGARKVYAAVRDPSRPLPDGLVPIKLDVTVPEDALAAAAACQDVTVLINNAGIAIPGGFLEGADLAAAEAMMATNYFGPVHVARAFAPVLASNGGGAILNVLSVASWITGSHLAAYAASKSAAWSMTNALRIALSGQGTLVAGLHAGFIDTDLTRDIDAPKSQPLDIVNAAFDGLRRGEVELLADEFTRAVHAQLSARPSVYLSGT